LHGAKIHRTDREVTLDNRIVISDHSFIDIVEAISSVTPLDGKKLVAVLLEQMCYRTNPECEYS
jgi:hypothetical protein